MKKNPSHQQSEQHSSPSHNSKTHLIPRLSEFEIANLPQDPGKRRKMSDFHPDDKSIVRRTYLDRKPCQPKNFVFPQTLIGPKNRRFNVDWFDTWPWLEYSVEKDAAFCFACYLFKEDNSIGRDAFTTNGFKYWNRLDVIKKHVGSHKSVHSNAMIAMELFKNQKSSIITGLSKQTKETMSAYRTRLEASVETIRWLLLQGLPFRGHDEKESSLSRGNFVSLLTLLSQHDPEYSKVVFKLVPGNCQLTSPVVQKDIINACAKETTKAILEDMNGGFFAILADESADVSDKEQMALCLRYVNKKGEVCEHLLGVVHVPNTTSLTLKSGIESLLMEHSLTFSQVRGQGYDGASNMQGSINGLKALILEECPQAYFVHCFAHQLQLTQVALAKKNSDCGWLFVDVLAPLLNFVGGSPKRKEFLREKQAQRVWKHYSQSLDKIGEVSDAIDSNKAQALTHLLMSFDFVFVAHLMVSIFGITNALNVALQKRDQDIVNAMAMVDVTKINLQKMRDEGWDSHMEKVTSFMSKYDIEIPNMEERYHVPGRRMFRGKSPQVTNLHHFRVEVFLSVIDLQLQELENRFPEISKELLVCMSCFNPTNRFSSFDKTKLIQLAKFYPNEFSSTEMIFFDWSLENFIVDVRGDERFWNLKSLHELSMKLVETGKSETHDRVYYLLLKLVLVLPVATASVERVFSSMTQVKDKLRNSMGDQMLNDCLITYVEKEMFLKVSKDDIINRYQNMKTRQEQL
ncbi:uncharacterized protein LOC104908187 [Beta vulgaris subsp. vulgaris]|uniref:uncharacterized protein LOC104908187 n=1 Tax=Beta vulgaris subsp. vulgaris TaxID=3555 RepID=UPI0025483BEE|nr:uncharacterized protein LOC104908187 [Beta vulgaris subsp. vulgaris]